MRDFECRPAFDWQGIAPPVVEAFFGAFSGTLGTTEWDRATLSNVPDRTR